MPVGNNEQLSLVEAGCYPGVRASLGATRCQSHCTWEAVDDSGTETALYMLQQDGGGRGCRRSHPVLPSHRVAPNHPIPCQQIFSGSQYQAKNPTPPHPARGGLFRSPPQQAACLPPQGGLLRIPSRRPARIFSRSVRIESVLECLGDRLCCGLHTQRFLGWGWRGLGLGWGWVESSGSGWVGWCMRWRGVAWRVLEVMGGIVCACA